MAALPPVIASLVADTADFKAKMAEARGEMDATATTGSSKLSTLGAVGKTALLGIAGAAVGVGIASVDMGEKLETSQNQLQASLKAAGISWDQVKGSVDATGKSAEKYGYTQAQVDSALNLGVISTQSYTQAHKNEAVAIELAAAKHVSLDTAMQAVDKATQGNTRALMQLGISLPVVSTNAEKLKTATDNVSAAQLTALAYLRQYPDAIDATSSHYATYQSDLDKVTEAQGKLKDEQGASKEILDALSDRLSGQASAAADTFSGKVHAMEAQGENLAAQLGLVLMPYLERLVDDVESVVNWFEKNKTAAELLVGALGAIAAVAATAFAIDKITSWVGSIQSAVTWVTNLGTAAAVTAPEVAAIGAEGNVGTLAGDAEKAAGEVGTLGSASAGAGAVGGVGAAEGGAAVVAGASTAAVVGAVVVTAIPLVAGALGLLASAHQGSGQAPTGSAAQKAQQAAGKDSGTGGLVSPINLNQPVSGTGFLSPLLGTGQKGGGIGSTQAAELAALNQMKAQLAADSAKYGATSAQAHADAAALSSSSNKWGSQAANGLSIVDAGIKSSFLQLVGLQAKEDKLNTTGAGNLKQSEYIKAVLDNQLTNAKSVLAKDETAKASKQAIDQAKQKVTDTQSEIKTTTGHIDQLKNVADQITKTKDAISSQQALVTALGQVKTETSNVSKVLGSGITVSKLPSTNSKVTGSPSLKVS